MNQNEPNPDWVNANGRIRFAYEPGCFDELKNGFTAIHSETVKLHNEHLKEMSTEKEQMHPYKTEAARYRHIVQKYCYRDNGDPGCGIDLASQGDPIVPWAWNLELPPDKFAHYNSNNPPHGPIQLFGDATQKFVEGGSLDFVFSSHLLEDFKDWDPVLRAWVAALKPGGYLIILLPDKERWQAALRRGQPPNCQHRHESHPGELSTYAERHGLEVFEDRLTDESPEDYTILFVGRKK